MQVLQPCLAAGDSLGCGGTGTSVALQTIKDRWAEGRSLPDDKRWLRKQAVPNADGEPEQVL